MLSVRWSTTRRRARARRNTSEHRPTAGRSASATVNARVSRPASIASAETRAPARASPWPTAMSLITCRLARVAPVTRAIRSFSARSRRVSAPLGVPSHEFPRPSRRPSLLVRSILRQYIQCVPEGPVFPPPVNLNYRLIPLESTNYGKHLTGG